LEFLVERSADMKKDVAELLGLDCDGDCLNCDKFDQPSEKVALDLLFLDSDGYEYEIEVNKPSLIKVVMEDMMKRGLLPIAYRLKHLQDPLESISTN